MIEPNDPPKRLPDMEALLAAPSVVSSPRTQSRAHTQVSTFDTFYANSYHDIARALSITLGDAGWGREAADEAMTRAFDRWDDVAGYANPAGWVYRVGLNWARSWHRKLNRRLPWTNEMVSLPQTHDTSLDEALSELDVKYRAVVVCRYLLDWSTEETARALDLPTGTVKSRLSTGLAQLRAHLGEPDESTTTDTPENDSDEAHS